MSIIQKVALLDMLKEGMTRRDISDMYGLPSSTLHDVIRNEHRIRKEFESDRDSTRKLIRESPFNCIDQIVVKWIRASKQKHIYLTGPLVKMKALEFAKAMGVPKFTASDGWLDRLKKRENIDFKVSTRSRSVSQFLPTSFLCSFEFPRSPNNFLLSCFCLFQTDAAICHM